MSFDEVRFPTDISYGSVGGPEYSTEVVELASGHEVRNRNWTYPRERWNVAYGVKTKAHLLTLAAFFHARAGRAVGFRFKNHDDFQATNQELGVGDGSTVDFQLVKHYASGPGTGTRKITKPVAGTVTIYLDSVLQVSGWTLNTATGVVTFTSPPASGEVVTADFDFDIAARFDTDYLPVDFSTYQARSAEVPIVELKL